MMGSANTLKTAGDEKVDTICQKRFYKAEFKRDVKADKALIAAKMAAKMEELEKMMDDIEYGQPG